MADIAPLPAGARVLHIGPFKTGSTAVQWAFHLAREELAGQGVHYVGRSRHAALPARWVTDNLLPGTDEQEAAHRWAKVVAELRGHPEGRTLFSSEYLCKAGTEHVQRIVGDVGAEDAQVVVTLRPLAAILPSQYQQYLQGRLTASYDDWLAAVLDQHDPTRLTPSFWHRHRHDALVRRWGEVVGMDRVVVVMMDDRDFAVGLRAFEGLLGLSGGPLVSAEVTSTNRSLTWAEAELLRAYNVQLAAASPVSRARQHAMLTTLVGHVKDRRPGPDEPRITTPAWAVRRANEIGAEMAGALAASGARIVGDLGLMSAVQPREGGPRPTEVDVEVAGRFAVGVALAEREHTEAEVARVRRRQARARRGAGGEPEETAEGVLGRVRGRLARRTTRVERP